MVLAEWTVNRDFAASAPIKHNCAARLRYHRVRASSPHTALYRILAHLRDKGFWTSLTILQQWPPTKGAL